MPQDSTLDVNLIGPVKQTTRSVRTATSFTISKYVRASLNHDYSKQLSSSDYGRTRSGSTNSTYFVIADDPLKNYSGLSGWQAFVPDWSVQISNVEKLLFFSKFAKSVSIDHAHQSKYTENLTRQRDGSLAPNTQTFSNSWQPLIGMNIRTKWGFNGTVRYTKSANYNYALGGGATKTLTSAFSMSVTYAKTSGFKIPIPVWPFKNKTFKNEINFQLSFDLSNNQTFQRQAGQKSFVEKQRNKTWKLRPAATYRFSSRVQGSLFFETGVTDNKISGKYSYNEFGITVNIAIRD